MSKLILYMRVSTEEQISNTSLKDQRYKCYTAAAARGDEIVAEFSDPGWSGTILWRPELWKAIQRMKCLECEPRPLPAKEVQVDNWFKAPCACGKNAGADGLIVWDMKRLSRSSKNLIFLVNEVFHQDNKGLIVVSGPGECDTRTPQGRFIISLFGLLAELDRAEFIDRTKDAKKAMRREGKCSEGPPPFGFRRGREKGVLHVNDAEAAIIVWMMTQVYCGASAEGKGEKSLQRMLLNQGLRTRSGAIWHPTAIRRVLYGPPEMEWVSEIKMAYDRWHETAVIQAKRVMEEHAVEHAEKLIRDGVRKLRRKMLDTTGGAA